MRGYAYPEVGDASEINRKGATPHERQYSHDEHPAGWVRNVSQWIFTGVKNVLIGVVNPKSNLFHVAFLELGPRAKYT